MAGHRTGLHPGIKARLLNPTAAEYQDKSGKNVQETLIPAGLLKLKGRVGPLYLQIELSEKFY